MKKPKELGSKKCLYCNTDFFRKRYSTGEMQQPDKFLRRKFCSHRHYLEWHRGPNHQDWKGGFYIRDGYVIQRGTKKRAHRLIMELVLKRPLKSSENVHHIDHNKTNNDPSNLMLMTRAEHCKYHGPNTKKQAARASQSRR